MIDPSTNLNLKLTLIIAYILAVFFLQMQDKYYQDFNSVLNLYELKIKYQIRGI